MHGSSASERVSFLAPAVVVVVDDAAHASALLRQGNLLANLHDSQVVVALASWRMTTAITHDTGAVYMSGVMNDYWDWLAHRLSTIEREGAPRFVGPAVKCRNASQIRDLARDRRATHIVVSSQLQSLHPLVPWYRNIGRSLGRDGDAWSVVVVPVCGAWRQVWRMVMDTERAN